jgi:2-oxoisovalerate dehydrogenase E1 component
MGFPTPPAFMARRRLTPADLTNVEDTLLLCYSWMFLSRTADNRILELFRQGLIRGTVTGGQGNEALIVPLALLAEKETDVVSFTHRDLAGHLIWSGHLVEHLCQYFANAGSPTKAREGNVHHGDPAHRSLPMISHLGAMLSNVLGATDAQRRQGHAAVGFAIFGDGGSSTGDVHETMNLASVIGAPVVFVVENNRYAYSTPTREQYAGVELHQRAAAYGFSGQAFDATDAETSLRVFAAAIEATRRESRPVLLEGHTLRLRGHAAYDTCNYLQPGEAEAFAANDPVPKLRARLAAAGHEAALAAVEGECVDFVEACIAAARAFPPIEPAGLEDDVYAPPAPPLPWQPTTGTDGDLVNLAQALNHGLRKILRERPESLVLGQDIATYGGAFKVTDGLLAEFGRPRVFNTPLAESACVGYCTGLALAGLRPILEFQFADFSTEAFTQITLNAATYHFRSGARVPLVLRLPCGGGLTFGSFHSQELEALFLAQPGLKALYPSTPQDAFDALLAAYEDDNPVLLFEHKALYRRGKTPIAWNPAYREVWQPRRVRAGDRATFVTYGEMVHLAEEACAYLETEYEATFDLFDLRALAPLRLDAIAASLARTHRLIVLHEGRRTHGFGAELVARLTEQQFFDLEAPPLRLAALDLPVPFAPELEAVHRPSRDSIAAAIADWLG